MSAVFGIYSHSIQFERSMNLYKNSMLPWACHKNSYFMMILLKSIFLVKHGVRAITL